MQCGVEGHAEQRIGAHPENRLKYSPIERRSECQRGLEPRLERGIAGIKPGHCITNMAETPTEPIGASSGDEVPNARGQVANQWTTNSDEVPRTEGICRDSRESPALIPYEDDFMNHPGEYEQKRREAEIRKANQENSNQSSQSDLEQRLQDLGLTAPRITQQQVEDNIVHTEIVKHVTPSGQVLRWAVLTTKNGYAVTGRPSVSVSSANDNESIGREIAIENAKQELWPLMGYELKTQLAKQGI